MTPISLIILLESSERSQCLNEVSRLLKFERKKICLSFVLRFLINENYFITYTDEKWRPVFLNEVTMRRNSVLSIRIMPFSFLFERIRWMRVRND